MLYTRDMKIKKTKRKRGRISALIILILILVLNTSAWYIYISEVSSNITTHLKSWKIEFDNNISQDIDFAVENIYPGMETDKKDIQLLNKGEMTALVTCNIIEMRILEEKYVADDINITSEELIKDISENYPFKVKFFMDGEEIREKIVDTDSVCDVIIEISWEFESGDDEKDTYWGNKAYDFMQENPDVPCIEIKAKIKASQYDE